MTLLNDLWISRRALAGFIIVGFGWASFTAQMPAIKSQVGIGDGHYGVIVLLGSTGAIMAMWLAPAVAHYVGRTAMAVGAIVMAVGFAVVGLASSATVLAIGLFLAAAGSGVTDVLANAEVSARESEHRTSLMNLNHGMFSLAYAGSAMLVGLARGNGAAPIMIFAALALCVIIALPFLRAPAPTDTSSETQGGGVFPQAVVWIGGLVVMAAFIGEAATEGWSALHIERSLNGSPEQGAMGPAILGATMAVGRIGAHLFAQRLAPMRVMALASLIAAFGLAIAGIASTLPTAYIGFALAGLGASVIGPLALGVVGQTVPPEFQLTAISRAAALGFGAFFIGPVLMGGISEATTLGASFVVIGMLMMSVTTVLLPQWRAAIARSNA